MDENFAVQLGRDAQLKIRPAFLARDGVPIPTKNDFNLLKLRRGQVAVEAALNIASELDAIEFLEDVGLQPLLEGLVMASQEGSASASARVDATKAICCLMRKHSAIAVDVAGHHDAVNIFTDMIEGPIKKKKFKSDDEKKSLLKEQREATAIVQRMVRSSVAAADILKQNERLRHVLSQVALQSDSEFEGAGKSQNRTGRALAPVVPMPDRDKNSKHHIMDKKNGVPIIVEFLNLKTTEMARVALWGMGGTPWKVSFDYLTGGLAGTADIN